MDIAASEEHLMARNAHDLAVGVSLAQHFGCLAIMHLIAEEREHNDSCQGTPRVGHLSFCNGRATFCEESRASSHFRE
jgi:hypothetical protein